jgi:hypothetical protein
LGEKSLPVYVTEELVYNVDDVSAIRELIVAMILVHCFAMPRKYADARLLSLEEA